MVAVGWVPERGEIIWIDCDPQAGHEQAGHRPALVLSPSEYNYNSGLVVLLPITSQVKGHTFELILPTSLETNGAILCDQVKNFDWQVRKAKFKEKAPKVIVYKATRLLCKLVTETYIDSLPLDNS